MKVDIEKKDTEKNQFYFLSFKTENTETIDFAIFCHQKRLKMAQKLLILCIQATVWSAVVQLPGKVQVRHF